MIETVIMNRGHALMWSILSRPMALPPAAKFGRWAAYGTYQEEDVRSTAHSYTARRVALLE